MTVEQIERELIVLPPEERLRLARWLLDTLTDLNSAKLSVNENPLLNIAGRFSGGSGDTAERAEEILEQEVNPVYGLGIR